MKIKRTTYDQINKRFSGFKRLTVERNDSNLETGGLMPIKYRAINIYRKQQNCTYIAITCIGYLDLFGPSKNDLTYIMMFDGKVTTEELIDKNFQYHEEVKAIVEELEKKWREDLEKIES